MATPDSNGAPKETRVSRVWRGLAVLAAAIALACAVAAGRFAAALRYARVRDSAQIAALSDRITGLEHDVENRQDEVAQLREQVNLGAELLGAALAPDSRIIRMSGLAPVPQASAVIVLSSRADHAMMRVSGLPAPPPGRIYALWWIAEAGGAPTRGALFRTASDGTAIVAATLPPPGTRIAASAITLEALKGGDRPNGATYLKGAANGR